MPKNFLEKKKKKKLDVITSIFVSLIVYVFIQSQPLTFFLTFHIFCGISERDLPRVELAALHH